MKGKFFSKLKDYNYILDQLLEKKCFRQDVKNLLLSMVYKVETSYSDYTKIKRNNLSKSDFIENIIIKPIRENCNYIYLVNPKDEERKILEKQNVIAMTNEAEKTIYAYPTEMALLYGLSDIRPKYFFIGSKYNYIKNLMQEMLVEGTNLNNTEVIRNFNGWSWNVEIDQKINNTYNCMYQTLLLLFGHAFLDLWENDFSGKKDYILEKLCSRSKKEINIPWKLGIMLVIVGVPILLIAKQPDYGTAFTNESMNLLIDEDRRARLFGGIFFLSNSIIPQSDDLKKFTLADKNRFGNIYSLAGWCASPNGLNSILLISNLDKSLKL